MGYSKSSSAKMSIEELPDTILTNHEHKKRFQKEIYRFPCSNKRIIIYGFQTTHFLESETQGFENLNCIKYEKMSQKGLSILLMG